MDQYHSTRSEERIPAPVHSMQVLGAGYPLTSQQDNRRELGGYVGIGLGLGVGLDFPNDTDQPTRFMIL